MSLFNYLFIIIIIIKKKGICIYVIHFFGVILVFSLNRNGELYNCKMF